MTRDTFDAFTPPDRGRFGDNESAEIRGNDSVRSNLVDLTLALHHQTDKAVLVSMDGDKAKARWLPKSKIEIDRLPAGAFKTARVGAPKIPVAKVTVPRWLAREKGLEAVADENQGSLL